MPQPLVSVLIPCFNNACYVGEAIESALAQTYGNVEVVVIDDGSTDGSVAAIERYGGRITWEAGPNRGACAARNRALELSKGSVLQFLDADDRILPDKITRQMSLLAAGEYDVVSCRGYLFEAGKTPVPKKSRPPAAEGFDPFEYCLKYGLATEGPLIRRELAVKVNGFRPELPRAQEKDFHIRLAAAGARLTILDEYLYEHREHDGPRITRKPQAVDFMLNYLIDLSAILSRDAVYNFSDARRSALAAQIFQQAVYAYRNGAEQAASRGFSEAKRLSRNFPIPERWWYRISQTVVGPVALEKVLKSLRGVRAART